MNNFSQSPFLLHWATTTFETPEQRKAFLTKFEAYVREDERKKVSTFLHILKDKYNREIEAHISYLENDQELRPKYHTIVLDLQNDI